MVRKTCVLPREVPINRRSQINPRGGVMARLMGKSADVIVNVDIALKD